MGSDYILGAVGVLQFEVTMARLKAEYGVDAIYEPVDFTVARWIECRDRKRMAEFEKKNAANLARDSQGCLSYLTTSEFQLKYCMDEWPEVEFVKTREIA
jgi:peptide chain release factor 3